jgi:hypothetical protein
MTSGGRGSAWQAPSPLVTALLFSLLCVVWGSTWLVTVLGTALVLGGMGLVLRRI